MTAFIGPTEPCLGNPPGAFRPRPQPANPYGRGKGTTINADEAGSWDGLHARFEVKRINHQEAYSMDGACTNWAEEFFSRMRRQRSAITTI